MLKLPGINNYPIQQKRYAGTPEITILAFHPEDHLEKVILETTAAWVEVIEFYLRCGFHIHYQDGNVNFTLNLL